ncbi:MAG: hypothetical protein P0107_02675 [Nitrosomonas sp.]|nr:hypothetical protein [Nitrosomonas sp.]
MASTAAHYSPATGGCCGVAERVEVLKRTGVMLNGMPPNSSIREI